MRKSFIVGGLALLGVGTAGAVWASSLALTSAHLGASSPAAPKMFATSLTTANGGNAVGRAQKTDSLTVNYSRQIQASTLCGGAATTIGTQTLSNATVTIGNNSGSTGDDVLTVAVPTTSCTSGVLHFGSVDLGSAGYVSGSNAVFSSSTITLTQTSTSAALVITLGNASGGTLSTVSGGAAALYTPDATITDTAGNAIGTNLAEAGSSPAF